MGNLASLRDPLIRLRYHPEQISDIGGTKGQFFYSRMAMISYWLRIRGFADPVDVSDSASAPPEAADSLFTVRPATTFVRR